MPLSNFRAESRFRLGESKHLLRSSFLPPRGRRIFFQPGMNFSTARSNNARWNNIKVNPTELSLRGILKGQSGVTSFPQPSGQDRARLWSINFQRGLVSLPEVKLNNARSESVEGFMLLNVQRMNI